MKFGCLSEKIITNGQFWESLILGTLIQTKTWSSCFGSISKFPTVCHLDSFVHGVGVCLRRTDVGPPVLQPHPLHLQHRARLLCGAGGQGAALERNVIILCRITWWSADTLFIPSEWIYLYLISTFKWTSVWKSRLDLEQEQKKRRIFTLCVCNMTGS